MDAGDLQELHDLQLDFLGSTRDSLETLRKHAASLASQRMFKSAFPVLLYLLHQMKGSGGSLGFPRVTELAARMHSELNLFLDESEERPTPEQLSASLLQLADELEQELEQSVRELRGVLS